LEDSPAANKDKEHDAVHKLAKSAAQAQKAEVDADKIISEKLVQKETNPVTLTKKLTALKKDKTNLVILQK
jgi:hypothetical protein